MEYAVTTSVIYKPQLHRQFPTTTTTTTTTTARQFEQNVSNCKTESTQIES